ncbi:MAG: HAD-IA family hydrolase, partial [Candidatus Krumholzibacteriota bacterium]
LERWRLYDDVLPALDVLSSQGWTHVILSNHVPELGDIVQHLGLASRVARVFNSAEMGYEKPHSRAFQIVLEALPGTEAAWMIGDNSKDIEAALNAGIRSVFVTWGFSEKGNGDHVIEKPHKLLEIVASA